QTRLSQLLCQYLLLCQFFLRRVMMRIFWLSLFLMFLLILGLLLLIWTRLTIGDSVTTTPPTLPVELLGRCHRTKVSSTRLKKF
ncbi:Unknown protein, partial [Striga hermonthica]